MEKLNHGKYIKFSKTEMEVLKKAVDKLEAIGWQMSQSQLVRSAVKDYCQKVLASTNLRVEFT